MPVGKYPLIRDLEIVECGDNGMIIKGHLNGTQFIDRIESYMLFNHDIREIIFNPPATIVYWWDGDKTVVKTHDEDFDYEKGLAMAVSKHYLGCSYKKIFNKAASEAWEEYNERKVSGVR